MVYNMTTIVGMKTYPLRADKKITCQGIAYNFLRKAILEHKMPPGSPIVEQNVSNLLEISRTPVREALKQLEAEGLIQVSPTRGYYVTEINLLDVVEIFEIRLALESLALKTAINKITDEDIEEMEAQLNKLTKTSRPEEYYQSDRNFHDLLVRRSNNHRLAFFLSIITSHVERFRVTASQKPERKQQSRKEHKEVLKYIKNRDFKKAQAALTLHINHAKESVIHICEKYIY